MNTENSIPSKKPLNLKPPEESKTDDAVVELEQKLEAEKDRRLEERFVWVAVTTILLTVLILHDAESEMLPIAVVLLELPLLFWLAKKMGVESVAELFDRLISDIGKNKNGG